MQFDTRAIHDGQPPDPSTGAVTVPIYQTSTYVQEAVGELKDGYDYSRTANPTRRALETCLASLESAEHGFAFASGMAATTTVMHLVSPGDLVVSVNDVYGGTYRLFSKVYEPRGVRFSYLSADQCNTELERHLGGAKMLWLESPTNPLLNVVDIAAAAEAAHAAGAILVVDNTFASPYLQRPIELGADIVVHSATKYLGGHSDLVSGFAATSDAALGQRLAFLQNSLGAVAGPFDSWLVLRGLKTLPVRMRQHCENARAVVGFLAGHAGRHAGALPRPRGSPGPRHRRSPDARLRRHDLVPGRRRAAGARRGCAHARVVAGREPGRRREPDRDAGADDPLVDRRRAVRDTARTWCGCRWASSRRTT